MILNSQLSAKPEYSFLLKNEEVRDHFDQVRPSSDGINENVEYLPHVGPSIICYVC